MMGIMTAAATSSREDLSRMWRSQLVFWHLVFAVVWGTAIVIVLVEPPGRYGRGAKVACLVGVVLAYAVLALRGLVQDAVGWGTAYLAVAWGLVLTVQWLTARELEVLRLVARGMSNPDVGRELFIAEATVKTHLLRTFAKLGVTDRTAAVTAAYAKGLIELG
jgi:DNA-binding CsgD family transcriptional regulator